MEAKQEEEVQEIFLGLDSDGDGLLNMAEMRVFISQLGDFCGSADEWPAEYERLSAKFNFEPKEGVTLEVFREIMGHEDELIEAPEEALSGVMTSDSEGESEAVTTLGRLAAANTEKNMATKGPPAQRASQLREPLAKGSAEVWGGAQDRGGGGSGPTVARGRGGRKGRGRGGKGPKGDKEREAAGGSGKGRRGGGIGGDRNTRRGVAPGAGRGS